MAELAGQYRIEACIGRGGVGSVYRARDIARGCVVALKRLELPMAEPVKSPHPSAGHNAAGDDSARSRDARRRAQLVQLFQREYQTLAQLAHPRIIEVYDYGVDAAGPYYSMELLEGRDLSKAAPLPWPSVCSVLRDVASALTLLHARRLLHRDISPRNVHCSPSGVAKLIDFGAMTTMGLSDLLVGTPSFVSPEAVQSQALDARSDLYSLGALGYFLLTGRAAHPARSFAEVRDAFRTRPQPPAALVPEIPAALSALVMQLMSVDRNARPRSAVELVERLTALAGLAHDTRLAVPAAYLTTPTLVGRHRELLAVRRRALRALRGQGACLLVTGPAGSGRSRFLDACALEGKLAGALVLRAAKGATGGVPHGAVRAILLQLHALLSDQERQALELSPTVCRQLLPGLDWTRGSSRPTSLRPLPDAQDPTELPRGIQSYLASLSERRALMIIIDDVESIDEPSAAVLAGLAPLTSRQRLVLVASEGNDATSSQASGPSLRTLRAFSRTIPLSPLSPEDTQALFTSVFGAVPNVQQLAHRLHAMSDGLPRTCMELAQHLLDTSAVRYEAGGFVLPETLDDTQLPRDLETALRARFMRLYPDARRLGVVIALADSAPLTVAECMQVAALERSELSELALSDLVSSQLFTLEDAHVALRLRTLGHALLMDCDPALVCEIRERLGELFARTPELLVRGAQLLFLAGEHARGLAVLLQAAERGRLVHETLPSYHDVIEMGLAACEQLKRPAKERFALRRAQLHHRIYYTEPANTGDLLAFAHELATMAGLSQWHALGEGQHDQGGQDALAPGERLTRALQMAAERYAQTPQDQRELSPEEAIPELARFLAALAGHGSSTFDLELIERIPSLGGFVDLAPGIQVAQWIIDGLRALRATRHDEYVAHLERVIARLDEPDHAGLPARERKMARLGTLYSVALTDAALGHPRALERARELEEIPSMRLSAVRVRQIAHAHRGEAAQAEECRKELELLLIQRGNKQAHQGTTLETEAMCHGATDDLLGLRRVLPEIEHMARMHPGWRPLWLLARGELQRIRGCIAEACQLYAQALAETAPGRHMMWPYALALHTRALIALGQAGEAKAQGLRALEHVERGAMGILGDGIISAVARAEAALGEPEAAVERLDALIARSEAAGLSGVLIAMHYEERAQLALQQRDAANFLRAVQRAREHFGQTDDSPFSARAARLMTAAHEAGLINAQSVASAERRLLDGALARLQRELAMCAHIEERAERALAALIDVTGARGGCFFAMQQAGVCQLASVNAVPPEDLRDAVASFIERERVGHTEVTAVSEVGAEAVDFDTTADEPDSTLLVDDDIAYVPYALSADGERDQIVAAVVLTFANGKRRDPPSRLLAAIGEELTARGDLTRVTLMS